MSGLAIFVLVAIVGQIGFVLWARRNANRFTESSRQQARQERARLLEDAADRQCVVFHTTTAKLDAQEKGVGGDE